MTVGNAATPQVKWVPSVGTLLRGFTLFACAIYLLTNVILVTQQWAFDDIGAYLGAADRLRHGAPLYFTPSNVSEVYRYAPWFAFLWIPLLSVPRLLVEVVWAVALLAATGIAMAQFRRTVAELCLALLMGALLFRTAGWGNIQPLLVLSLMYLLPTRAGPWALGVASSLKVLPILFVAVYVWRRDWRSVAISLGVAAALWLPILFFDYQAYPASRGLNIYDATLLLAVPGAILHGRHGTR